MDDPAGAQDEPGEIRRARGDLRGFPEPDRARQERAPSFETIEQIAKRLRVPVMALFDFSEGHSGR